MGCSTSDSFALHSRLTGRISPSNQSLPLSTPLHPILWPISSTRTPGQMDPSCKHCPANVGSPGLVTQCTALQVMLPDERWPNATTSHVVEQRTQKQGCGWQQGHAVQVRACDSSKRCDMSKDTSKKHVTQATSDSHDALSTCSTEQLHNT